MAGNPMQGFLHLPPPPRPYLPLGRHRRRRFPSEDCIPCQRSNVQQSGTSRSWRLQHPAEQTQALDSALDSLEQLNSSIAALDIKARSNNQSRTSSDIDTIAQLRQNALDLGDFLSGIAPTHLYTRRNRSGVNHFSRLPPELREEILFVVSIQDVLNMQQTSRDTNDFITGSNKLQQKLHLLPNLSSNLSTPFETMLPTQFASFSCCAAPYSPDLDMLMPFSANPPDVPEGDPPLVDTMRLTACFNTSHGPLPKIGARVRKMFICQPPVFEMIASPDCCAWPFQAPFTGPWNNMRARPSRVVRNVRGITIGDVLDATAEMVHDHRLCPLAGHWSMDEDGYVRLMVYFETTVKLKADDPRLLGSREELQLYSDDSAKSQARAQRMQAYSRAKQNAAAEGRPIPTLQEYEDAIAANIISPH